jgi:methanogenic corrinoid protein MtbC1
VSLLVVLGALSTGSGYVPGAGHIPGEEVPGPASLLAADPRETSMTAPEFPEIELALISSAMSGDAGKLYRIASNLMEEGVPFESVLFDYLLAAERSVGQRWAQGDYLVAEEHTVTASIETVISLLIGMFDQPAGAPLVVVATAEGDEHSLPARAAAAHLVYLGYRTIFLGASVPSDDLRDFLGTEPPQALVLSVAMTTHLVGARAVIAAAHDVGVPVVAGGKGLGDGGRWSAAVGADSYVESLRDVAGIVESWVNEGSPQVVSLGEPSLGVTLLRASRSAILAGAEAGLDGESARLRDETGLLLGAIEGALLTGDDQIVVDMLEWQETHLGAYGLEGSAVADALASALAELSDEASAVLTRARDNRAG